VRAHPPDTGQSSIQRVADAPEALVVSARRLIEAIDYHGPGSVQAIEDERGFFVHDVNLRVPITLGVSVRAGLDMPARAVSAALALPLPPPPRRYRRLTYVSLAGEAGNLRDGLHGRPAAASPLRVATGLALAALLPGRMLDPPVPTRFRRLTQLVG
jgi:hypothetical protein